MKKYIWPWFLIFLSCDDELVCGNQEEIAELYLQFFTYRNATTVPASFNSITAQYDTIMLVVELPDEPVGTLRVPVNALDDQTIYDFETDSGVYKLKFNYASSIFLDNRNCPPVYRIGNLRFEDGGGIQEIDSIGIRVQELSTLISPHVEVYL